MAGIRSPIGGAAEHWDLETWNGYGGPLASPDADPDFLARAWAAWKSASRKEGMVAAFFRLHPLLDNSSLLPADSEVRADRKTVYVDLSGGAQSLWQAASSQHRNMVNRGAREGAKVCWNDPAAWDEFITIYCQAMLRLDAPARLRFSSEYFSVLRSIPGCELASIATGGSLAAAAVFLFGETWSHYHLAARAPDSPNYAMNCLLQASIERTAEKNLLGMHLGGGKTNTADDSLLKFKKSTGGEWRDFKVALVVSNEEVFSSLCENWTRSEGLKPTWLLGYRQPQIAKNTGEQS